jgi:hypothetical protein
MPDWLEWMADQPNMTFHEVPMNDILLARLFQFN